MNLELMSIEQISSYIQNLDKENLLFQTKKLVDKERELTAKTLVLFCEIEKRLIHLEKGFGSLHDFLVNYFGLSDGCASRRVASVRLMTQLPEIEVKIRTGELTLSNIAAAQRFFNSEAKNQAPLDLNKKREVLECLLGKTTRQAERELIQRSSVPLVLQIPDQIKPKGAEHVEIRFLAPQALADLLEEARGLLAHRLPTQASMADVIHALTKMGLEKIKKERFGLGSKPLKAKNPMKAKHPMKPKLEPVSPAFAPHLRADFAEELSSVEEKRVEEQSRYIEVVTRRAVFTRAGGKCEYVDPISGQRCNSSRYLELDHCQTPFARGGAHTIAGLALVCRNHNSLRAVQDFGSLHMQQFKRA